MRHGNNHSSQETLSLSLSLTTEKLVPWLNMFPPPMAKTLALAQEVLFFKEGGPLNSALGGQSPRDCDCRMCVCVLTQAARSGLSDPHTNMRAHVLPEPG